VTNNTVEHSQGRAETATNRRDIGE